MQALRQFVVYTISRRKGEGGILLYSTLKDFAVKGILSKILEYLLGINLYFSEHCEFHLRLTPQLLQCRYESLQNKKGRFLNKMHNSDLYEFTLGLHHSGTMVIRISSKQ
jgi:hypothetical protein